jgi:hypothetical protein
MEKEVSGLLIKRKKTKKSLSDFDQTVRVRLVSSQPVKSKCVGVSAESQSDKGEYKLHIVMDKESVMRLRGLKAQLEASTDAEVIRRALKAYEIFEPADEPADESVSPNPENLAGDNVEHLYIRIPNRMKSRLDTEYKASGHSYGEQVRQALRVLTQLCRLMEMQKRKLAGQPNSKQKGEVDERLLFELAAVC